MPHIALCFMDRSIINSREDRRGNAEGVVAASVCAELRGGGTDLAVLDESDGADVD